ncbi:MAG: hypothetical protein IJ583_07160 [Firmicutes bacterium]|nr:hypothetical protein [Bacillota bacterium]
MTNAPPVLTTPAVLTAPPNSNMPPGNGLVTMDNCNAMVNSAVQANTQVLTLLFNSIIEEAYNLNEGLKLTIAKLNQSDIIRTEILSDEGNVISYKLKKQRGQDVNIWNEQYEVFANWQVSNIELYVSDDRYKYNKWMILYINKIKVKIPMCVFETNKILSYLEKEGLTWTKIKNLSKTACNDLFKDYIVRKMKSLNTEYKPAFFPFGWNVGENNSLEFISDSDEIANSDNFPLRLRFLKSATEYSQNIIKDALSFFNIFSNQEDRIGILAIVLYSSTYTLFKNKGLDVRKLFVIDTSYSQVLDIFFDLVENSFSRFTLNSKSKQMCEKICFTKDVPLVCIAEDYDFSKNKEKDNLKTIKNVFLEGGGVLWKNMEYKSQSTIIIKSHTISAALNKEDFIQMSFNDEDLDFSVVSLPPTDIRKIISEFVVFYIDSLIKLGIAHSITIGVNENSLQTIFTSVLKHLNTILSQYKIDFMQELNLCIGLNESIELFIEKTSATPKVTIDYFKEAFAECIADYNVSFKRNINGISSQNTIFIIGSEIWLKHTIFEKIVKRMGKFFTVPKVKKSLCLYKYGNSYETTRSYSCNNERKCEKFIVLYRKSFNAILPEEEREYEKKISYWK